MQPARLWRELSWPQERWPLGTLSLIPIREDLIDPQPRVLFNLCEDTFATNLRSEAWSGRWPVRHDGGAFAHLVGLRASVSCTL